MSHGYIFLESETKLFSGSSNYCIIGVCLGFSQTKEGSKIMKRMMRTASAVITLLSVLAGMTGCTTRAKAANLMKDIKAEHVIVRESADTFSAEVTDFALRLFKESDKNAANDKNTLISPLSVLLALSMTSNGANGETLSQMQEVLGLSPDDLNKFAYAYMQTLEARPDYAGSLELANSIWYKTDPDLSIEPGFLQINADYYGADLYAATFDDSTLKDINSWVNDKTKGMIPEIVNDIGKDTIMFLINALAFEAEWQDIYKDNQVRDDKFKTAAGEEKIVSFLNSRENTYIEDENSVGVIKYYKSKRYAFAAILPNEGSSPEEYLSTLSGAHLSDMLANKQSCEVITKIPKFKTEYSVEMSGILSTMGMPLAFDLYRADFRGIGTCGEDKNIFISKVLHKTFIQVDEKGTKAGAATAVMMDTGTAMPVEKPKPKEVYLTRPFIYMLIDCETNTPFFIGVMRDPKSK